MDVLHRSTATCTTVLCSHHGAGFLPYIELDTIKDYQCSFDGISQRWGTGYIVARVDVLSSSSERH